MMRGGNYFYYIGSFGDAGKGYLPEFVQGWSSVEIVIGDNQLASVFFGVGPDIFQMFLRGFGFDIYISGAFADGRRNLFPCEFQRAVSDPAGNDYIGMGRNQFPQFVRR